MKRNSFIAGMLIAMGIVVLGDGMCFAEMRFIVNVNPATFLISPDADDFSVSSTSAGEEIDGNVSWMPTALAGVEFDADYAVYSLTGGGGYLYNDAFRSPLVQADGAVRFKTAHMEIGPHVGVLYFIDPEWEGAATVSLDESVGILGGISLVIGRGERFRFFGSLDYVNGEFDVTGSSSWRPNQNEIDYSGALVQIGAIFGF